MQSFLIVLSTSDSFLLLSFQVCFDQDFIALRIKIVFKTSIFHAKWVIFKVIFQLRSWSIDRCGGELFEQQKTLKSGLGSCRFASRSPSFSAAFCRSASHVQCSKFSRSGFSQLGRQERIQSG